MNSQDLDTKIILLKYLPHNLKEFNLHTFRNFQKWRHETEGMVTVIATIT
jgi:hypothetical protein